ncbi:MAG: translation initiation factor IF-2 [Candidatus Saganbacteria bacterium]|nr:translation initiation factor IF-2 [Candidatus Saganbacteria bacterium]
MKKVKVSDLAKKLETTSKELLKVLADLGVPAKTAASSIDEETAKTVTDLIKGDKAPPKKEAKEKAKKPARPVLPVGRQAGGEETVKKEKVVKKKEEPEEKTKVIEKLPAVEEKKDETPGIKEIIIKGNEIVVRDLAGLIGVRVGDLIKEFMKRKILVSINQSVSFREAEDVAGVFNVALKGEKPHEEAEKMTAKVEAKERPEALKIRPPVVVVMGHVDHGKTKLLDAIRKTKVAEKEAGGITQHIGAYQVEVKGRKVTFLDTPGHESFTMMRARGAKVTDIVVLVVAADDGVMPQTIEALNHARAANVPIIVAINKIDKPEANIERVKHQLVEHGLSPEEWGGDTIMLSISAKLLKGIDELLDMILLVADVEELKANPDREATGVVIESKLDKTRGPVATVLIKSGTLRVGDPFVIGGTYGKIRAMFNEWGERLKDAPPSTPAMILGISNVPMPGDLLKVTPSEKEARILATQHREIQEKIFTGRLLTLENFSKHVKEGERKDLNLILKTDVQGSLEALTNELSNLQVSGIHVNIIHSSVGNITESDIMLAKASESIIVGFHVDFSGDTKALGEDEGVDTRIYDIIYKVSDDIKLAMEGMLEPEYEEVVVGHAEVRALFSYSKVGIIAGSFVSDGKMVRGSKVRIIRDGKNIYEGKLESLKRFKEDVKEVESDFECGISIMGYTDFQVGDIIESFEIRVKRKKVA